MSPFVLGVFQRIGPTSFGTPYWAHPDATNDQYLTIEYWQSMARKLEAAHLDFLFLADSYGFPVIDGDVPDSVLREAVQIPFGDPFTIVSAIAAATKHLGIVVTGSTAFEPLYANARRLATLDHFTRGRLGWNVVTAAAAGPASAMFGVPLTAHDARYDMADEYLALTYRMLEGSWEPGAVVKDRDAVVYADPDKVHRVDFDGEHYRAHGVFGVEPSPQRVPVLFQAGSSERGREFAARHAECVFLQGTTVDRVAAGVADIRRRAVAAGRTADAVKIIVGMTVFVAPTETEARDRFAEFATMGSDETAAAQYAHNTGINLLAFDLDKPLPLDVAMEQGRTNVERYLGADGRPAPTVREILDEFKVRSLRGVIVVGDAAQVADQMQEYAQRTGVDGFLLEPYIVPRVYDDIIDLLLPELRRRGLAPGEHTTSTLRERFFGDGPWLPDDHPGAAVRAGRVDA